MATEKKEVGRPEVDNPKIITKRIRVTEEFNQVIKEEANKRGITQTALFLSALKIAYDIQQSSD